MVNYLALVILFLINALRLVEAKFFAYSELGIEIVPNS
ncbi:hypothetical protein PAGA_a3243 [Pseudoalteromonas agarivorans DSM 14585]|uniref:Uncharacterized protein n=1 Tax=Pseudoalteromonas agarivorans DSM 14585 TaxID=1312369 RepID=A0ACA8DZQ0_9GAMM|nr:hypothetical protein PAGA_a3243 [Pseudoalteromonas agarivorans DSM 14585]